MKTKFWLILAFILSGIVILSDSCTKYDAADPGDNGSTDRRERFLGTWNVSDQPARLNYIVKIEKHSLYEDKVKLNNFADLGGFTVGIVVGNTIVIEKQELGNNYKVEGTGTYISSTKLEFNFLLDDGIDLVNRKAVFTK